jgi:ubiquinone/menaquinone biosynthesis C-methylase UbiE
MKKNLSKYVHSIQQVNHHRLSDRLQHLLTTLQMIPKHQIVSFLDIGCGNAEITDEIGQLLHITNVYGADVFPTLKRDPSESKTQYHQVVDNQINLLDHSIDLITCFMSIHHFENFPKMMTEIGRLLKPDGLLFIREHDVPPTNGCLIQELNEKHKQFPDHSGPINYWSRSDLHKELIDHYHFIHLADSNYPKHINNKQAIYHALYKLS